MGDGRATTHARSTVVPRVQINSSFNQGEQTMSFRDDYAAALRDEQQAKDTVNEARRAHKVGLPANGGHVVELPHS